MNVQDQIATIERGTTSIYGIEDLAKKLEENRPLNIKFGIDPTAPDIHLGHTVPLQKLRQFQTLGHRIQLIIGDYTAMIGDPSGRSETRPILTADQIQANLTTYTKQVFKILDEDRTEIHFNSHWLGKFSGQDLITLMSKHTAQQLLERRDFSKRIEENRPLSISELVYPLLVGYDSVHLQTDVEIGGTDQLFNFMASRNVQESHGMRPEVVVTLPLLEGVDGKKKMSKSLGNAIGVEEHPNDIYGKIMSISDTLMLRYYELLSDIPTADYQALKQDVANGAINPMEPKLKLAFELVNKYHGQDAARSAEEHFARMHRQKIAPLDAPRVDYTYNSQADLHLTNIMRSCGYASSNSEANRLLRQGAVRVNGSVVRENIPLEETSEQLELRVGKKNLAYITLRRS